MWLTKISTYIFTVTYICSRSPIAFLGTEVYFANAKKVSNFLSINFYDDFGLYRMWSKEDR
jgi:hypothetical protein